MKKVLKYFLYFIFVLLAYLLLKFLPDFYLNLGKQDYFQGNYASAYKDLKTSLLFRPNNLEARNLYAKTMLNLKPTLEIQKELYKVSQSKLNDSAALIAQIQIQKWKSTILSNIGTNYIDKVPFNEQILRWDVKKFPLKVYIQKNSTTTPPYFEAEIKRAFLQWQGSAKFIKFVFVNNEQDANIVVQINSSDEMKKCDTDDCKYTVAYTKPEISDSVLEKMNIIFYDSNNLGKPFSQTQIFNTAIHEIVMR